ncbi:MAG: hypothetical protein M1835_001708 [Candelina submexicana]|nr:MAG: hypothetical protein M1835_001708 [Candelina submexicana]
MAFLNTQGRWKIVVGAVTIAFILIFAFREALQDRTGFRRPIAADADYDPKKFYSEVDGSPIDSQNATDEEPLLSSSFGDCTGFPNAEDILIVMKTGATEAYDKLPIHLLTTLRCTDNYLVFSDMEQDIGGYHVFDSLDEVDPSFANNHKDFDLYRRLKEYQSYSQDVRTLKVGDNAWNLDKYKFIYMLEKTYRARPDPKWYVFIEADTYLVWSNLLRWLDTLDHRKPLYLGSPSYLGDIEFSHGGSGFILSQAAMEDTVGKHPGMATRYQKDMSEACCGDAILAKALLAEGGVKVTKRWPMIQGEKPTTIPFDQQHWCVPVVTMHHLSPEEVTRMWQAELQRENSESPLIFADIYNHFVSSRLSSNREDWNNLSDDLKYTERSTDTEVKYGDNKPWDELTGIEQEAFTSLENCLAACTANEECFGWMYHDKECSLSRSIKLGGRKVADGPSKWVSGWMMERVEKLKVEMEPCKPKWITGP